jgi:hypothetical protein
MLSEYVRTSVRKGWVFVALCVVLGVSCCTLSQLIPPDPQLPAMPGVVARFGVFWILVAVAFSGQLLRLTWYPHCHPIFRPLHRFDPAHEIVANLELNAAQEIGGSMLSRPACPG